MDVNILTEPMLKDCKVTYTISPFMGVTGASKSVDAPFIVLKDPL